MPTQSLFDRLTLYCLATLVALLPTLYSSAFLLTFETPKQWFFLILLSLALGCFALGQLVNIKQGNWGQLKRPGNPVTLLLLGLTALYILATLWSDTPALAWEGSLYRQSGLFLWLQMITFFLLVRQLGRQPENHLFLLGSAVVGGILVGLSATLEALGQTPMSYWKDFGAYDGRLIGSLGQPNLLAGYLGMLVPVLLYFKNRLGKAFQIPCLLLSLWFVLIMIGTGSRGAILGFALIALMGLGLWAHHASDTREKRRRGLLALLLPLLLLTAFWGYGLVSTDFNRLRTLELIDTSRLAELPRTEVWSVSLGLIGQQPALGYGPDTFAQALYSGRVSPLPHLDGQYFDHPHNLFLATALDAGVFAMLLLGGIYLIVLARTFSQKNKPASPHLYLGLSVLFYVGWTMVNPSAAAPDLLHWLLLGLLTAAAPHSNALGSSENELPKR